MISAAQKGDIRTARRVDRTGYQSVFVNKEDVDQKIRPPRPPHSTIGEFSRSVGLHRDASFLMMVKAGHTPATELFNPRTCRKGLYVTRTVAEAFHARFTTLKLLSAKTGEENRSLSRRLHDAGIARFSVDGRNFSPVYLVKDVEGALSCLDGNSVPAYCDSVELSRN